MPAKILEKKLLRSMIPISRFNKGEANKIFSEVQNVGVKIVLKNNIPACVLLSPQYYEQLLEELEDYHLLSVAKQRLEHSEGAYLSEDEVMDELGITEDDIAEVGDVEIE